MPGMVENRVKKQLAAGGFAFGTGIAMIRTPAIMRLIAGAGYDFVFIDMEHSSFSFETINDMCDMARSVGLVPVVRPYSHDPATGQSDPRYRRDGADVLRRGTARTDRGVQSGDALSPGRHPAEFSGIGNGLSTHTRRGILSVRGRKHDAGRPTGNPRGAPKHRQHPRGRGHRRRGDRTQRPLDRAWRSQDSASIPRCWKPSRRPSQRVNATMSRRAADPTRLRMLRG